MQERHTDYAIRISVLLVALLGILSAALPVAADQKPDDAAALAGLDAVKSVFLVNRETAPETARYLKGILSTHKGLSEQGVVPTTVLVFIGKPVRYITTQPEESIAREEKEALESIASTSKELKALGIRLEVCSAATKHFGVDNASLLPEMDVVGNGFISLIGWQSKGHVPMTF